MNQEITSQIVDKKTFSYDYKGLTFSATLRVDTPDDLIVFLTMMDKAKVDIEDVLAGFSTKQ